MESLKFEGSSVDECLRVASETLDIPVESINYTILEDKKGLFKKRAVILVQVDTACDDINSGTAAVKDGKIVVKNPKEKGKAATIIPGENVRIIVNGQEIRSSKEVFEDSLIEVLFYNSEPKRSMDIRVSEDKITAYIDIEYIPQKKYALIEKDENSSIVIDAVAKEEKYPPNFTKEEIVEEISKIGIKYGIIDEMINKCTTERKVNNEIIAKGVELENDIDDWIELKFAVEQENQGLAEDEHGRVDYKNVGAVIAIAKGDTVAIKHEGKEGHDGVDIFGKVLKKSTRKLLNLRVGSGCVVKDNEIIALSGGKPCIKNNVFYVYEIHEVTQDVDLSTGNIKFIGDIKIHGAVKEGMVVEAGNALTVEKNVENAKLTAKGNVDIKGNIIFSNIAAGGQDINILTYVEKLNDLKNDLSSMVETISEIKKFNLLGGKSTDGEIIKALIENKFKNVVKLSFNIITLNKLAGSKDQYDLVALIRSRLVGLAPLEIRHFNELERIIEALKSEIKDIATNISLPVTVKISYAQDSIISSSGDIFITGKGEYVSNITAYGNIYFTADRSVARGGTLKAKDELKCKMVGSTGGVLTRLEVEEKGQIWIDEAYQNTLLVVGHREFNLEIPSRNVHAYINNKGDLIVDRLKL
jgi:uncharacterized protein (DUF342 family)